MTKNDTPSEDLQYVLADLPIPEDFTFVDCGSSLSFRNKVIGKAKVWAMYFSKIAFKFIFQKVLNRLLAFYGFTDQDGNWVENTSMFIPCWSVIVSIIILLDIVVRSVFMFIHVLFDTMMQNYQWMCSSFLFFWVTQTIWCFIFMRDIDTDDEFVIIKNPIYEIVDTTKRVLKMIGLLICIGNFYCLLMCDSLICSFE